MTDQETLNKAIEKAQGNGFERPEGVTDESVIFWNTFAIAFFKDHSCGRCINDDLDPWQFHLAKTVQSDDSVKYIEKFL